MLRMAWLVASIVILAITPLTVGHAFGSVPSPTDVGQGCAKYDYTVRPPKCIQPLVIGKAITKTSGKGDSGSEGDSKFEGDSRDKGSSTTEVSRPLEVGDCRDVPMDPPPSPGDPRLQGNDPATGTLYEHDCVLRAGLVDELVWSFVSYEFIKTGAGRLPRHAGLREPGQHGDQGSATHSDQHRELRP